MLVEDDQRSSSRSPSHSQQVDDANRSLESLAKDNETLRAMLRRALGPNAKTDDTTVLHLQTALDRSQESLRHERHRRSVAESLVAELRHDREMSLKAKDGELRKLQDIITHLMSESTAHHRRSQEDQQVIEVLKRENQRLLDSAMQPRSPSSSSSTKAKLASPDYTNLIRSERLRKDVPSCTLKHIGKVPPVTMKREIGHRGAVSGKPRDHSTSRTTIPLRPRFEVGQRCTCNRIQGVVRYIGDVVGLGKNMAGVELLVRGAGDNEGSFNGVQYFRVPHRTAMFCPISQLQPAIETRAVTPLRAARSPSTSTTPRRCHACPPTERDLQGTEMSESPIRSLNATRTTAPHCESENAADAPVRDNSLVRTDREDVRFSAPREVTFLPTAGSPLYSDPSSDHLLSHTMLTRTDNEEVRHIHPSALSESDTVANEEDHHNKATVADGAPHEDEVLTDNVADKIVATTNEEIEKCPVDLADSHKPREDAAAPDEEQDHTVSTVVDVEVSVATENDSCEVTHDADNTHHAEVLADTTPAAQHIDNNPPQEEVEALLVDATQDDPVTTEPTTTTADTVDEDGDELVVAAPPAASSTNVAEVLPLTINDDKTTQLNSDNALPS